MPRPGHHGLGQVPAPLLYLAARVQRHEEGLLQGDAGAREGHLDRADPGQQQHLSAMAAHARKHLPGRHGEVAVEADHAAPASACRGRHLRHDLLLIAVRHGERCPRDPWLHDCHCRGEATDEVGALDGLPDGERYVLRIAGTDPGTDDAIVVHRPARATRDCRCSATDRAARDRTAATRPPAVISSSRM